MLILVTFVAFLHLHFSINTLELALKLETPARQVL
jgi:hypothetical protein